MAGVRLSRWTMAYFALALMSFTAAQGLMAAGYGFPNEPLGAPQTLIVVHLVAIGWLSLLMCGALFQFVPVLLARPIHSDFLPLPALALLVVGLAGLMLGFLQLTGWPELRIRLLPMGAGFLALGFAVVVWTLGRTLWSVRPLNLPARFVAAGLSGLAATVGFGLIFASALAGATLQRPFDALAGGGLPLHVMAGLGGWLTLTAIGVSYRLLSMFMLAPERDGPATRWAFYCGLAALAIAVVGGVAAIATHASLVTVLLLAGMSAFAALALYGRDVVALYRLRRRRVIELNSRISAVALVNLAASVILGVGLGFTGLLERHAGALVFLFAFGWLSSLGLAQLYKITAFLTWLECYGPVLGKTKTPHVQDLVVEHRAAKWFWLFSLAVWTATAALLAGSVPLFRAAMAAMLAATLGIVAQLVRTRLLADVSATLRLPEGRRRPRLLFSLPQ